MKIVSLFIERLGEITKALLIIFAIYSVILLIAIGDFESMLFILQKTLAVPFWALSDPKIATINMLFVFTFGVLSEISSKRKKFVADLVTSTCWVFYSIFLVAMMT